MLTTRKQDIIDNKICHVEENFTGNIFSRKLEF